MAEEEVKGVAEEGTGIAEKGASIGRQMRVMVAIDESECSRYALEWTLDRLSEPIAASKLTVFTAQPMAQLTYIPAASGSFGAIHSFGAVSAAPELIQTLQRHHMKVALGLLERAKAICDRKGVAAETITEVGDPRDVICAAVEKLNIDLLIMGSHGRGPLQRIFLGSVSNHCVHHAKCSVLVVRK